MRHAVRTLLVALVCAAAIGAMPALADTERGATIKAPTLIERCGGHLVPAKEGRAFSDQVWRLPAWDREPRGAPPAKVIRAHRKKLRCARGPGHRKAIRRAWRADKKEFYRHRKRMILLERATPYGAWAIPGYIVSCESGGNFRARNPVSTAGGAYQIIDSTWYAYGGAPYADSHPAAVAPPLEQHIVAGRILADVGTSAWECA